MAQERFTFDKMLSRLQAAKVDMPKEIAEAGQKYFALNFRKQQSPDGVAWAPRKEEFNNGKYTKSGSVRKKANPILVKTGWLRSHMDHNILSFDWHKIVWGIDESVVPYAKYLNFGTPKMIARPFITTDGREIKGKIRGVIKRTFDKVILGR